MQSYCWLFFLFLLSMSFKNLNKPSRRKIFLFLSLLLFARASRTSATFHPIFTMYGVMKVVIIVIDPTIGNKNELVTPTSTPPLATTKASSPPDDDRPKPVLSEVRILTPCILDDKNTVKNFAAIDTKINAKAGTMNMARRLISIKAPTDTKNIAANISLIGVAMTLVTEWTFDSAINTPAKNAPVATDILISYAIKERPNAIPKIVTISKSC